VAREGVAKRTLATRTARTASKYLRYPFVLAISALLVWLFTQKVNFAEVGRTIARARLIFLLPIASLLLLSYLLQSVRWKHLVRHITQVSTGDAFPRVIVSNTANIILPFQLGQLLMVQISAEKFGMDRAELLGAEFVSRMMDGLVFALFLALALATLPIGSGFTALAAFMLFGTITGFALCWWLTSAAADRFQQGASLPARAVRWLRTRALGPVLPGLGPLQDLRQTRDIFLLSLAAWSTEAAFYWMTALALDINANPLAYVFLLSAANIGAGLPLAQAGVGFIVLAQQALMTVGKSRATATAFALSLQALLAAPIVLLGPIGVYSMHLTWSDVLPWRTPDARRPAPRPAERSASRESELPAPH
jgi:uncharacterized membrane protein YbhN (UPF0104 family)